MKRFLKKNKYTTIALLVFIILVVLFAQFVNIFFPRQGEAIYGNRLDGINEVKITAQQYEAIENVLTEEDSVLTAEAELKGRLLNVIVDLKDDVSKETAKELPKKVLEQLEEDKIKYYDIQVFLKKKNEDASFPIIAYKHHKKDGFSYTKDR